MADPSKLDLMLEAERRGILPPDKTAYLKEARRRGLIANPAPEGGVSDSGSGYKANFVDRATNAMAFGFGDNLAAGGRWIWDQAGIGPGKSYDEHLTDVRGELDTYAEENPGRAIVADVLGGTVTGGAVGGPIVGAAKTTLGKVAAGAGVGSAEGAVAGAGFGDEEPVPGAIMGAGVGGVVGAAVPGTIAAGRGLSNKIAEKTTPAGIKRVAQDKLVQALMRDGLTPEEAAIRARQMGPAATLADTGKNATGLAQAVATRPGKGAATLEDALTDRANTQFDRVMSALDDAVIPSGKDVLDPNAVSQQWATALAKPVTLSHDVMRTMGRPSMKRAFEKARTLAAEAGEDVADFPTHEQFVNRTMKGGEIVQAETRFFHWMKKALDDILEPKRSGVSGELESEFGKNELRALRNTRETFRTAIKNANPDYAKALASSERQLRLDTARDQGSEFFKRRNEREILAQVRRMTPEQKRAYQQGAVQVIEDRINQAAQAGYDITPALLRQTRKIKAVFGDRGNKVIAAIKSERAMAQNKNAILRGSQTANKQQAVRDFEGDGGVPILEMATGDRANAALRLGRMGYDYLRRPSEAVGDEVANYLVAPPQQQADLVRDLLQRANRMRSGDRFAGYLAGGAATGAAPK